MNYHIGAAWQGNLHQRELIQEVEQLQLARQVPQPGSSHHTNVARALALMGRGLANLGARLEKRYGQEPEERVYSEQKTFSQQNCADCN